MEMHLNRTLSPLVVVALLAACGGEDAASGATRTPATPNASQTAAGGSTQAGRGGSPGQRGAGGRGGQTLTLAESDVAVVKPTTIEDVAAISGDLHPIETVSVRARIEGDLDAVSVRDGQTVRAGQVLATFDASEQQSNQKSAEADRASAQADLANAQWNAEQSARLFKAGAIADRDNKAAQQAVTSAQARLAATEAKLRSTAITVRDTRVIAPTTGVIEKRLVENGEHVSRGTTMFTIVRNDVLELVAAMPARDAGAVRVGQSVRFIADGKDFAGRVARVSPTIDPVTRAVTVYVEVPNPSGAIRGGTFATGQVISRTVSNVIAIPRDALHQAQDGVTQYAYRIQGDLIELASVRTGVVDERQNLVEITDGLKAGDRIITGNVGNLGRGMKVSILGSEGRRGQGANGGNGGARRGAGRRGGTP
jgi:RND family efflux transporter MFP subunit